MKKRYSKKFVDDFLRKKENEIEKIIKKIKISNSINPKNIFNKVFYENKRYLSYSDAINEAMHQQMNKTKISLFMVWRIKFWFTKKFRKKVW